MPRPRPIRSRWVGATINSPLPAPTEENALTGDLDIKNNLTINGEFGSTGLSGSLDRVFSRAAGGERHHPQRDHPERRRRRWRRGAGGHRQHAGAERSTVRDNVANADSGGGIYNAQGTLTLVQSTLTGNYAPYGSAIFNHAGADGANQHPLRQRCLPRRRAQHQQQQRHTLDRQQHNQQQPRLGRRRSLCAKWRRRAKRLRRSPATMPRTARAAASTAQPRQRTR